MVDRIRAFPGAGGGVLRRRGLTAYGPAVVWARLGARRRASRGAPQDDLVT